MSQSDPTKPDVAKDKHIPPPTDPYATYQTPYERRPSDDQNPFIEFRRFADRQMASFFNGFGNGSNLFNIFGMDRDGARKLHEQLEQDMKDNAKMFQEVDQKWKDAITELEKNIKEMRESGAATLTSANDDPFERTVRRNMWSDMIARSDARADRHLPTGWQRVTTSDGTSCYLNSNTGTVTRDIPSELEDNEVLRNTERSDFTRTDRCRRWRRNRDMYNQQKSHADETELDVYERNENEAQTAHAHSDTPAQIWSRGLKNCPELSHRDDETELAMYEQLEQRAKASACTAFNDDTAKRWQRGFQNCPGLRETGPRDSQNEFAQDEARGLWRWLPAYGFDGMQKAKSITLHVPRDSGEEADDEHNTTETTGGDSWPWSSNGDSEITKEQVQAMPILGLTELFNLHPESVIDAVNERIAKGIQDAATIEELLPTDEKVDAPLAVSQQTLSTPSSTTVTTRNRPSIVSTLTRTSSRTLPDGSIETRRVLKQRFADGSEESEESTDITPPSKSLTDGSQKSGWFWN